MKEFLTDIQILNALQSGEEHAFDHVYGLYYKPLCYFAEKIMGSPVIAEDMASESFIKLLQKKPTFDSLNQLKSFLYTSTRNSCYDLLRMKKRHDHSHAEIRYLASEPQEEIENRIIQAEVLNAIYTAIEQLPERYKNVVRMALVAGMNNDEIASETGMANQTVRNHKSEGLKLLRLVIYQNKDLSSVVLVICMLQLEFLTR